MVAAERARARATPREEVGAITKARVAGISACFSDGFTCDPLPSLKTATRLRQRVVFFQACSHVAKTRLCAYGSRCRCTSAHATVRFVPDGGSARQPWRQACTDDVWTFRELLTAKFEP